MFKSFGFAIVMFLAAASVGRAADAVVAASAITSNVGTPTANATPAQRAWVAASIPERVKLAEEIGEAGARQFAKSKGWQTVFDGTGRLLAQGPDQIYRGADGFIHVVEAKGGTSPLTPAYGHPQGTSIWAVESAKRVVDSSKASISERKAAQELLSAAAEGRMKVHVVRTKHVLGEATVAVLEQTLETTDDAAKVASRSLARNVADDVVRSVDDVVRSADDAAVAASRTSSKAIQGLSRAAVPVAAVVDVALRSQEAMQVEESFAAGKITYQQREVAHVENAAGMAGGWAGAFAGAKLGASGGGIAGAACGGVGAPVGAVAGGVVGGVVGYIGGEQAAEAAAGWTMDKVHRSGNSISNAASVLGEKASAVRSYFW
jgi:hypothetical protein